MRFIGAEREAAGAARGWRLRCAFALLAFGLLSGCGDAGNDTTQPTDTGTVSMAIRDAEGDFVSYAVDVSSIQLQRANGDVVETLPLTVRVDLAGLVDLSELFRVATVPTGTYTRIVVNLDFSHAQIVAQNAAGGEVAVAPVDTNGNPLTTLSLAVDLPDSEPIRIAVGIPAAVTLDFDLDASNVVDFVANRVTVQPFLSVVPEFDADRDHRLRGLLSAVDSATGDVTVKVRPFHVRQGTFGNVTFATSDATVWEIDGEVFTGSAGLTALAGLALDTPVIARGTITERTLNATRVLAGRSVPSANDDVAVGTVTARNGDTLTVKGVELDLRDGTQAFRNALTVLVGDNTVVTALDEEPGTLARNAISIGSRVAVLGVLGGSTLDATSGRVRVETTTLVGTVVQVSPFVVDVARLGGLRPGAFDFRGAGATLVDPHSYLVDTGTLALSNVLAADVVRVRGRVHPFGFAPPAFDAQTIVDVDTDAIGASFAADWRSIGGAAAPFNDAGSTKIDVDLTRARQLLSLLGVPSSVLSRSDRIVLLPSGDVRGVYVVTVRGSHDLHVFRDFAALATALTDQLDAGRRLVQLSAVGRYNASTLELTTPRTSFEFVSP